MKAGILAAGRGERMRAHGVTTPKPLLRVGGVPLLARIVNAARQIGVEEIVCILHDKTVARYCRERDWGVRFTLVQQQTAHSLESFLALQPYLDTAPFLLFTTDTVFPLRVLPSLVARAARIPHAHGVLGVTPFVDDEKPLWVTLDAYNRIVTLGERARRGGLVTAGIYYFTPAIYREASVARRQQFGAFRHFLGHLIAKKYRLYGHPIPKVIDVDRPADLAVAEAFLAEEGIV